MKRDPAFVPQLGEVLLIGEQLVVALQRVFHIPDEKSQLRFGLIEQRFVLSRLASALELEPRLVVEALGSERDPQAVMRERRPLRRRRARRVTGQLDVARRTVSIQGEVRLSLRGGRIELEGPAGVLAGLVAVAEVAVDETEQVVGLCHVRPESQGLAQRRDGFLALSLIVEDLADRVVDSRVVRIDFASSLESPQSKLQLAVVLLGRP